MMFTERLVFFDLELQKSEDQSMQDVLNMQFEDANRQFGKFVESGYEDWIASGDDGDTGGVPLLSHRVLPKVLPEVIEGAGGRPVYLVVIDNFEVRPVGDYCATVEGQLQDS